MRAINSPFVTLELKSANKATTTPDTCVPTCTVTTAFGLPVAEMVTLMSPCSTVAVRY